MGQCLCEGRFAVASCAPERRRDSHGVPFAIEQLLLERFEFGGSRYKIRGEVRHHHWNALLMALALQHPRQSGRMFWQIEVVNLAKPAWQLAEIRKACSLYWTDVLALLPGEPNRGEQQGLRAQLA